jgi:hypothetical protein
MLVLVGICALLVSSLLNVSLTERFILDDRNLGLIVLGLGAILLGRCSLSRLGSLGASLVVLAIVFHPFVQAGMLIGTIGSNPGHWYSNAQQLRDIRHVMSITSPGEFVLDGWSGASVFRPHAYYYFSINREMRANLGEEALTERVIAALRETKCKVVVYDAEIAALPRPVQEFIHSHYRPTNYRSRYVTIYVARPDEQRWAGRETEMKTS